MIGVIILPEVGHVVSRQMCSAEASQFISGYLARGYRVHTIHNGEVCIKNPLEEVVFRGQQDEMMPLVALAENCWVRPVGQPT
jgi:hypothetical protein